MGPEPSLNFYPMKVYIESVDGEPLRHEYDLEFKDDQTILKYSNNKEWTVPGKQAASVINTGNGYIIKLDSITKPFHIDYAQAEQLFLLLMYMNDAKIEICETKVIKSI